MASTGVPINTRLQQEANNVSTRERAAMYAKPSLDRAREFQLRMHPSYTPTGREEERRFYGCCVPMGRFCTRTAEKLDPCCEGRISTFTEFGSGVTSFFKLAKLLAWSFVLMTVCSIPMIAMNVAGKGPLSSLSAITLVSTTVANLGFVNGTNTVYIPYWDSLTATSGLDGRTASIVYSFCDLGAVIILLIAYLVLKRAEGLEERQVDKDVVAVGDYSVFLPWVPPAVTEPDLIEYVRAIVHEAAVEAATFGYPELFAIAEVHLVEDSTAAVDVFVKRGLVFRQLERLVELLSSKEQALRQGDVGWTCCGGTARVIQNLKYQRASLQLQAEVLSEKARLKTSERSVAAFITFERKEARNWVLEQFAGGGLSHWLCQARVLRLKGHRMNVKEAPSPSSLLWGNLHITRSEQLSRQLLTGLLAAILLAASFVLLWFASWQQAKFSQSTALANCLSPSITSILSNMTTLASAPPNPSALAPYSSAQIYCYCRSAAQPALQWNDMTLATLQANKWVSSCPYSACPRWLTLDVSGVWNQPACVSWLSDRSAAIAITVGASVGVLIINALLAYAMRFLTFIEGHASFEDLNKSLALRLFWATFANTAALVIAINIYWPFSVPAAFETGKYSDFTVDWYTNVGTALIVVMLLNIVAPHVVYIVLAMAAWWRRSSKTLTAPSQRDLNEMMLGPYMDWSLRYAQLFNSLFVSFVFSAGMPLMLPIAATSFFVHYWIDKILFLWYFRRPPAIGMGLQRAMSSLIPYVIALHLAIGVWMLSGVPAFASVTNPASVQAVVGQANAQFSQYVPPLVAQSAIRVTQVTSLPLFILFLIVVGVMLIQCLLSSTARFLADTFNFLTCNTCPSVCSMCDGRKSHGTNWQKDTPTYHEACSPALQGTDRGMRGIPSYNLLLNPEIRSAFAIPYSFAIKHKKLADVAKYRSTGLVQASGRYLASTRAMASSRVGGANEPPAGEEEQYRDGGSPAYENDLSFGLDPHERQFFAADNHAIDAADSGELAGRMAGVPSTFSVSARRMAIAGDAERIARLSANPNAILTSNPQRPGMSV